MRRHTVILSALFIVIGFLNSAYAHRIGVWNLEKLSPTAKRGFPELRGNRSLPPRTDPQLVKIGKYLLERY